MGGGLLQLVAQGKQDTHLTGDPEVTYFKVMFRKYSNFAIEPIRQSANGQANFENMISVPISRNGDLVSKIYIEVELPSVKTNGLSSADIEEDTGIEDYLDTRYKKIKEDREEIIKRTCGRRWINNVGNFLIKSVEIQIGGQTIDKQYGQWMHVWHELNMECEKKDAYDRMIGNVPELTDPFYNLKVKGGKTSNIELPNFDRNYKYKNHNGATHHNAGIDHAKVYYHRQVELPSYTVRVPLLFSFCRHPGLCLPLIALQYHEVRLNIEFQSFEKLFVTKDFTTGLKMGQGISLLENQLNPPSLKKCDIWVDYVFLDNEERQMFAEEEHEYLIEQVQKAGELSLTMPGTHNLTLMANHPVKELVWFIQSECNQMGQYDINGDNPIQLCCLELNSHERFKERKGEYFNDIIPYEKHNNIPPRGINCYSFALKPDDHQPSGTLNFSRIDQPILRVTTNNKYLISNNVGDSYHNDLCENIIMGAAESGYYNNSKFYDTCTLQVYARSFNILSIKSGMGGIKYSN